MGRLHDLFTSTFGSNPNHLQHLLWSLKVWSSPILLLPELEVLHGPQSKGWRFIDLYAETVPYHRAERVFEVLDELQRAQPHTSLQTLCRDPRVQQYIDACVVVEFKTSGSKAYPFDLGDTVRQMHVYITRVRERNMSRGLSVPVVPILLLPSRIHGRTEMEMHEVFKTLEEAGILYRTYGVVRRGTELALDFQNRPMSTPQQVRRLFCTVRASTATPIWS